MKKRIHFFSLFLGLLFCIFCLASDQCDEFWIKGQTVALFEQKPSKNLPKNMKDSFIKLSKTSMGKSVEIKPGVTLAESIENITKSCDNLLRLKKELDDEFYPPKIFYTVESRPYLNLLIVYAFTLYHDEDRKNRMAVYLEQEKGEVIGHYTIPSKKSLKTLFKKKKVEQFSLADIGKIKNPEQREPDEKDEDIIKILRKKYQEEAEKQKKAQEKKQWLKKKFPDCELLETDKKLSEKGWKSIDTPEDNEEKTFCPLYQRESPKFFKKHRR